MFLQEAMWRTSSSGSLSSIATVDKRNTKDKRMSVHNMDLMLTAEKRWMPRPVSSAPLLESADDTDTVENGR